jgi:Matrixin
VKERGIRIAAAAALALAFAGAAHAYVIDEDGHGHQLHWDTMPVSYYLVTGNVPHGADGEAAVHAAFETWNAASANVQYDFAGYVPQGAQAYDGKNVVYWVYDNWPYDPTLAALTFRYYDTSNGRLLDADTVFNGVKYTWSVDGSGYDIQNSATHEAGHMAGLGHSTDPEATMYAKTQAGETKKRTLDADDVAGIEAIYGGTAVANATQHQVSSASASSTSSTGVNAGGGGGGCSLDPSGKPQSLSQWLFPVLLITSLVRRRAVAKRRARR